MESCAVINFCCDFTSFFFFNALYIEHWNELMDSILTKDMSMGSC